MATGLTVQRSATCLSPVATPGRGSNLLVIEHPMSRLGNRNDLAIQGSATVGGRMAIQRSNTDVGPKMSLQEQNGSSPRKNSTNRILNWPPEFLKGPGKPHVKSKEYNYQPRTTAELVEVIRDKFGTGYYGIRHLFRSNDPSGNGNVSREALQKILYTLCGYITPEQYTKLLRELKLEGKKAIHFDHFVQYFKDNEVSDSKNWVNAIRTKSLHQHDPQNPEGYLRRGDMRVYDPYTSMPFSDAIFKEKCRSKNFDAKKVFPESVFHPNGLILPPQLREAYASLNIFMTDEDFDKLWKRYDKEGTSALHTADFFRLCGLDPQGRPRQAAPYTPRGAAYPLPRPHSEISHTNGMDTNNELTKVLKKEKVEKLPPAPVNVPTVADDDKKNDKQDDTGANTTSNPKQTRIKKQPKHPPKLENVVDCLHYKFEEGYQAMLTAFQLFDFLNDNYVSKIDFRRVLQEFGFNISPAEVDDFLKKSGMRALKGQVNYREFLLKYQNRAENSITAKIAKDASHSFHGDGQGQSGNLTSESLEARLVEYFHGDFIKLISQFRQCDKYNLGVITAHEFRNCIERRLGYTISESQWERLKQDVGEDKDGLLPYQKFLELFDIIPGAWNLKQEGNIQVTQVSPAEIPDPPAVERLKERAKTEMVPPPAPETTEDGLRTLEAIKKRLDDVFSTRFHSFDKHFKAMDRRMTGRMSKWQFGALLKMCGLTLHPKELDRIWATLNVSTDGMYSYSTLIQHFVHFKAPPETPKDNIVFEDTTDLVETARRIQRERREEQMQRDYVARLKAREQNETLKHENGGNGQPQQSVPPGTALSRVSSVPNTPASRASFNSVQSVRTKSLLVKIRSDVVNNWDGLKSVFKYIDKNGTATIPISEMKDIMTNMHFTLDEEEKSELCKRFDVQRNGRFNYLTFMKCYAQRQEKQARTKPHIYSKYTHQLQSQLLKEHRTIRRAFKKMDESRKGYLDSRDFRRALTMCNINYTNEDMYHIMTEFDHDMSGKISYDHFLQTILTA